VILDADTQFLPDTLAELVRPLADPQVGAVSGHIRVGNTDSWIGRFQSLEYLSGFNLDRRAYDRLDAITVVPGAASAYRADAIVAAGGIQADTLAEDTDLTLSLHRAGYRIRHTSRAQAVTEAPQTAAALLRQRKRWSFGTLQCLWKHRDLMFDRRYRWLGLFAIPSIWFFHIFLVALVPVIDCSLLLALAGGGDSSLLAYVLIFMGIDLLLALGACRLEGEPLTTAWRVIPMRFLYRPLLSLAVLYALQRALRGTWVGWGAQERWGLMPRWGGGAAA
jgi:cellulose synthase/poly-beta-1,6-N-acetylglucosamine synthase-like glycosyltransferase